MKVTDCEVRARAGGAPLGRPHSHVPKPRRQAGIGEDGMRQELLSVVWGDLG